MLHRELTERIIGIFYQVYSELGHGFAESVYSAAMALALRQAGLNVEREVYIPVYFRGVLIGQFRADLIAENKVLIENKAGRHDDGTWEMKTLHYLRSTTLEVALVLHFASKPNFRRLIFTNDRKIPPAQ